MWFRRKKKPDPDDALTETLRSLQVLLEDEKPSDQILDTKAKESENQSGATAKSISSRPLDEQVRVSAPGKNAAAPITDATQSASAPKALHANHPGKGESSAVASTARAEVEPDRPAQPSAAAPRKEQIASDFLADLPIEKKTEAPRPWVDPFQSDDEMPPPEELVLELDLPQENTAQDETVIPSIDSIPVLNNVVYEPAKAAADSKTSAQSIDVDQLIAVTVNELQTRLAQQNLPLMDSAQQRTLHQALIDILKKRSTSDLH